MATLQHAVPRTFRRCCGIETLADIASGWRKDRLDNAVTRKFLANRQLDDGQSVACRSARISGTTFAAYRSKSKDVNLYGELHRFILALAALYGARIVEVPSATSLAPAADRIMAWAAPSRVMFDILTIWFR
jgi:hypothetical protein